LGLLFSVGIIALPKTQERLKGMNAQRIKVSDSYSAGNIGATRRRELMAQEAGRGGEDKEGLNPTHFEMFKWYCTAGCALLLWAILYQLY
jgi:hypothetical protein